MMMIYKYLLDAGHDQITRITMPEDALVLSVQAQNGALAIWAAHDEDHMRPALRQFVTYFTGAAFAPRKREHFLGTVQSSALVYHVFEIHPLDRGEGFGVGEGSTSAVRDGAETSKSSAFSLRGAPESVDFVYGVILDSILKYAPADLPGIRTRAADDLDTLIAVVRKSERQRCIKEVEVCAVRHDGALRDTDIDALVEYLRRGQT